MMSYVFRSKKLVCIVYRNCALASNLLFISESPWEVQEVVLWAGESDGKWLSHHNLKLPPASSPPARELHAHCAVYGSLGCNIWSRNRIRASGLQGGNSRWCYRGWDLRQTRWFQCRIKQTHKYVHMNAFLWPAGPFFKSQSLQRCLQEDEVSQDPFPTSASERCSKQIYAS